MRDILLVSLPTRGRIRESGRNCLRRNHREPGGVLGPAQLKPLDPLLELRDLDDLGDRLQDVGSPRSLLRRDRTGVDLTVDVRQLELHVPQAGKVDQPGGAVAFRERR